MSQALSRRRLLLATGAAALAGCQPLGRLPTDSAAPLSQPSLRLIGEARIAHGTRFEDTSVGGLSGLDYDAQGSRWFAISDDRHEINPSRFYTLRLPVSATGIGPVDITGVAYLHQADGSLFAPRKGASGVVADPEAIRWRPDTGTLLWTSEGDPALGLDPLLHEVRPDGRFVRAYAPPAHLMADREGRVGPKPNLAWEGLALAPDGKTAWTAMEGALVQDGPEPTSLQRGGHCRIQQWDLAKGSVVAEFAYPRERMPAAPVPPGAWADLGLSEILAVDAQRLLVMERGYITGYGVTVRLFLAWPASGSNTLGQLRLTPGNHQPMRKRLVADLRTLKLAQLDNLEGMSWGPPLGAGLRSLVLMSDDNFSPRQVTQFLAFEWNENL